MFPIFIAYFESVAREKRAKKKNAEPEDFFFTSFRHLSRAFDLISCSFFYSNRWRCGGDGGGGGVCVRLMINSISVLFPFKYFIPFRTIVQGVRAQQKN